MKRISRTISILLCLVMLLGMLPTLSFAAEAQTSYQLASAPQIGKTYVIVAQGQFALNNSTVTLNRQSSLGATSVTISNGMITSNVTSSMLWTIRAADAASVAASYDGQPQYFVLDQSGKYLSRRSSGSSGTAPLSVGAFDSAKPHYSTWSFAVRGAAANTYTMYVNSSSGSDYLFAMNGETGGFNCPGTSQTNFDPQTYQDAITFYEMVIDSGCDHSYSSVVTPATCTADGYTTYTCSLCGDSYQADAVAALGHSWDDGVISVQPSAAAAGLLTYTCGSCGETKTEVLPRTGADDDSYDIVFMSDLHNGVGGYKGFKQMMSELKNEGVSPKVLSHGGDYVEDDKGGQVDWQTQVYDVIHGTEIQTFPGVATAYTMGNHDWEDGTFGGTTDKEAAFQAMFGYARAGLAYADDEFEIYMIGAQNKTGSGGGGEGFTTTDINAFDSYLASKQGSGKVIFLQTHWPAHSSYNFKQRVVTNSDLLIDVMNKYADDMDLVWIWGHNHYEDDMRFSILLPGDQILYKADTTGSTWGNPRNPKYKTIKFTYANCGCMNDMWYLQTGRNNTSAPDWRGPSACLSTAVTGSQIIFNYNRIQKVNNQWVYSHDATNVINNHNVTLNHPAHVTVERKVPAHTHTYSAAVTAPTCTAQGYTTYTCTACGESYQDSFVPALGHTYDAGVVTAPTCQHGGYTTYTCTACGESYQDQLVPASEHTPDAGVVTAPTCQHGGYTTYTCTVCGESYQDELVPAVAHTPNAGVVTAPTCTAQGYTTYTCTVCGMSYQESFVPATGHTYDAGVVTAPTCQAGGYTTYTCTACGSSYQANQTGIVQHHYVDGFCTMCGEQDPASIQAADHSFSIDFTKADAAGSFQVVNQASTSIRAGEGLYMITTKNAFEPANGQLSGTAATTPKDLVLVPVEGDWEATLKFTFKTNNASNGYYQFFGFYAMQDYQNCAGIRGGNNAMQNFLRKNGTVTADSSNLNSAPGLSTNNGTYWYRIVKEGTTYTCYRSSDGVKFTQMFSYANTGIEAKNLAIDAYTGMTTGYVFMVKSLDVVDTSVCNHENMRTVVTAPTCTAGGYTTHVCANCAYAYRTDLVAALGHDYRAAVTAPTCTAQGCTTYTCSRCGDSYASDYVAAAGHQYVDEVKAPTCTADGYTTHTCAVCGNRFTDTLVKASGHAYEAVVTPATCTEDGYTTYTCSVCGDTYTADVIAAPGHAYEGVVTPATCTEDGYTTYTCAACGDTYTADVIAAPGHDYKAVVTPATCLTDGYTTYTCARCGDSYVADEVAAPGHSYEAVVTPATCTEDGYTTYTCAACGDTYTADVVAALGHSYEAVVTPATCLTDGYTTYTCAVCGDSYVAEKIIAAGHQYVDEVTAPTCTTDGYTTHTCAVCGNRFTDSLVKASGHDCEAVVTPATCLTDGYTTYTCSACGESYIADEIAAPGHTYEAVETTVTCTEDGHTTYTCSVCGDTYTADVVAAPGHSYEAVVTPATCTEDGYTTYTCAACGDSYTADVVAAPGHAYEAVVTPATCTEDGYTTYTCAACGDTYTADEVAASGHSYEAVVTPATCTEDGYTTYICAACGDSYVADEVAAPGHSYEVVVTPATCTEDGYTTYTCAACGDSYVADEVAAPGHSYKAVVTPATCTEDGYTTYTCAACGDTYTADVIAAPGHAYEAVVTPATCTEDGYTTYTCAACGDTYTADEVAAPGHAYEAVVTPATCTEDGYTTYTCAACGDSYVADEVAAPGHNYPDTPSWVWTAVSGGYTATARFVCRSCNDGLIEEKGHVEVSTTDEYIIYTASAEIDGREYVSTKSVQKSYTLLVLGGSIVSGLRPNGDYVYSDCITVRAPESSGGKYFSGWYLNGSLISTQNLFSFLIKSNTVIEARFDGEEVVEKRALVSLEISPRTVVHGNKEKVIFVVRWEIPESFSNANAGILRSYETNDPEELLLENVDGSRIKNSSVSVKKMTGSYTLDLTLNGNSKNKDVFALGYLEYTNARGERVVLYTDVVTSEHYRPAESQDASESVEE